MSDQSVAGALSGRILDLSSRLSYRRATDPDYRAEIFKLRHDAYVREGAIAPQPGGIFTDSVDKARNTHLFGIHIDGTLMSSIRVSVGDSECPDIPTAAVFPEILKPEIEAGKVIVDPTRFVVDAASSRRHPELPYVTLRVAWMAMEHFEADLLLAAVRPEHTAFYRRFWCTRIAAPARLYPHLSKPVALTVAEYHEARDQVHSRYPFMRSTSAERERIFGSGPIAPSSFFPTAARLQTGAGR